MMKKFGWLLTGICALTMLAGFIAPANAQDEPKEKPPMYTYISNWTIPRAQWGEIDKDNAANRGVLDKALADGTIIGYGDDETLVHQIDGYTHDNWWSSMSMAGLMGVLDRFYKSSSVTSPVLASATRHADAIVVSRFYNWRSGSYKGAYTREAMYQLKSDAPNDAVEMLSKHLFVPLMEKLLADGTILEYEVDTEAIHTDNPDTFWVVFVTPNAQGLDKFNAALQDAQKMNPMSGPAIGSMVDFKPHRDYLVSSVGTYK